MAQPQESGQAGVLHDLLAVLGIAEADTGGTIKVGGSDPVSPSVFRIGEITAAGLAAFGAETAAIWRERGGEAQDVAVSVEAGVRALMSPFFATANGIPTMDLAEDPVMLGDSDFYRAGDGRYIYMLSSYPQLRDINTDVLNRPWGRRHLIDAVSHWNSFELEEAILSKGGTVAVARTREEWERHPQGQLLLETPLIRIEKIGDSAPEPFSALGPASGAEALSGVRLLDNTHVVAATVGSRFLAEFGADVLHMSSPSYPDPNIMIIQTGLGKKSAFCDLSRPDHAKQFWRVLAESDVYTTNYLNLEPKGFGPAALAEARPGIVVLDYDCWGDTGPWAGRGGFDQLASSASGYAVVEGSPDGPKLTPTFFLNDILAGILGAAGMLEALRRRAREGGSYRVHITLAKVNMWVQSYGTVPRAQVREIPLPAASDVADLLRTAKGPFGEVSYLPAEIEFTSLKPQFHRSSEPLGASPLAWW